MPIRKHKKFSRPRKLFDSAVIKEETTLINKYGLKNRREVWRADFAIGKIRGIAKSLITADDKDKEDFVKRQQEKGFSVNSIADVLGLSKEDYLKRRLQSIVVKKELAKTHKQARQIINHKHISINGRKIDSPSHITTIKEEASIECDLALAEKKGMSKEEKAFLDSMKTGNEEKMSETKENNKENKE